MACTDSEHKCEHIPKTSEINYSKNIEPYLYFESELAGGGYASLTLNIGFCPWCGADLNAERKAWAMDNNIELGGVANG